MESTIDLPSNNIIQVKTKKTRKKPCPRGTRYNKKTENCEPITIKPVINQEQQQEWDTCL